MEDTNDVVIGSSVMSYDDYLKACGWKWYMISVHFLGWLRVLAIDLKKKHNITHRQFYDDLFNWSIQNSSTLLYKEYYVTMRLLNKVFKKEIPWGRKVKGASDIYWEYEEATGIYIAKNKKRFYNEIGDFLENTYNSRYPVLVKKQSDKIAKAFADDLEESLEKILKD